MPLDSHRNGSKSRIDLRATTALLLAVSFGLVGGYLDVLIICLRKYFWEEQKHFQNARDFPWSVPVVHVVLMLVPGLFLAIVSRVRAGLVSLRTATCLLAVLAIWSALLRLPLYSAASFVLACALGLFASDFVVACDGRNPRRATRTVVCLVAPLGVVVAISSGWYAWKEHRAERALPPAPPQARNVILVVWDTVRANNLSAYGYPRDTTPNLKRWANKGVRFDRAIAPAPWTFPSHACFFTGHGPYELDTRRSFTLESPVLTLAEHLAARGYHTAGFVGNTLCCSYESKLDRGFVHYDDYPLTLQSLLGRTIPGRWVLKNVVHPGDFHAGKWIGLQARDARAINDEFFRWLRNTKPNRPFFAFLNYFDAHGPYIPPRRYVGRFGIPANLPRDFEFLVEYERLLLTTVAPRDVLMARDRYDDCIAYLDAQLGRLLDEINRQGLLEKTLVIITSDHGEAFGDHGPLGHATSLFLDQIAVPLVILAPGAPAGRAVFDPVSLRDLPATVLDQAGLAAGSPFPGHSLAAFWQATPGQPTPESSRAFSELVHTKVFDPQPQDTQRRDGFQMSLVVGDRHYVRDGTGPEQLYDLRSDPLEDVNLLEKAQDARVVRGYRKMLLDLVTAHPGTREVERAYLSPLRTWLKSLVIESPPERETASGPGSQLNLKR